MSIDVLTYLIGNKLFTDNTQMCFDLAGLFSLLSLIIISFKKLILVLNKIQGK